MSSRDEETGRHRLDLRRSLDSLREVKVGLRDAIARNLERSPRIWPLVLSVDDDEVILETWRRMLAKHADVREARSVHDAIEGLREVPDLILLDLLLPDGNGFEIAALARSIDQKVGIVVVSDYLDDFVREKFRRLPGPAVELFAKDERAVFDKVREMLRTPIAGTRKPDLP